MLAIKGRYNGATVVFDSIPPIKECELSNREKEINRW